MSDESIKVTDYVTRYSVACRGSMNEKSSKCFMGGGWMSDEPEPDCPHCGKPMFTTARAAIIDLRSLLT